MLRSIIDHKKVFVLALNGPGVGGGAAWFEGVADIVLAAEGAYLQVPFNALGLVPENGSAISFSQSMGVHRANDFLMFGRQLTVEELEKWGMVNRIFPKEGFHQSVIKFLQEQLAVNDGKSMMETKRLQNAPLRDARIIAVYNSMDALAERFVEDAPAKRFEEKRKLLECEYISSFPIDPISMDNLLIMHVGCAYSQASFQDLDALRGGLNDRLSERNR
jgi:peroxisomal 3,2-trans-enoyl-CoA isomerase